MLNSGSGLPICQLTRKTHFSGKHHLGGSPNGTFVALLDQNHMVQNFWAILRCIGPAIYWLEHERAWNIYPSSKEKMFRFNNYCPLPQRPNSIRAFKSKPAMELFAVLLLYLLQRKRYYNDRDLPNKKDFITFPDSLTPNLLPVQYSFSAQLSSFSLACASISCILEIDHLSFFRKKC